MAVIASYPETNYVSNSYSLSNASAHDNRIGVRFNLTTNTYPDSAVFHLSKTGSPTGNMVAEIYQASSASSIPVPTGTTTPLCTSDPINASTLTTTKTLITFTFSGVNRPNLNPGSYVVVVSYAATSDAVNYIRVSDDNTSPTYPYPSVTWNVGTAGWATWNTEDIIFYMNGTTAPSTGNMLTMFI